ncbi:uncharacterized protein [Eucyclogobius newberryi]|uniref:uncharacterized protein n=1 Tax=Eucyclogobius newberryi TaxID=166745 RepID=UPI003B5A0189
MEFGICSKGGGALLREDEFCREKRREEQWFSSWNSPNGVVDPQILPSTISSFKDLIWNNNASEMIPAYGMTPEEMARLCSEGDGGWLLSSHMEYIMNKMMTSQEHTLCFCLNATHALTRMTRLQEQLEHFKDIKRLVFTMNVGKLPDNSVYIGGDIQPGNHWTLAVVKLVTGEVLYCDSMAWGLPEELCPRLQEYTSFFDKILSPSSIKMCHTRTPVAEVHTCDPSCTNYPLQTWSDLCGVVSIITAAIATFDQPFFNFLCGPKNKGQFYLRNPTRCSKYLRLVLISWFVSGRISINNVSLKKLPKAQPVMFAQGKVKGRSTQKRKRSSSQSEGSTEKTSIKHKKEPNDVITPADIQRLAQLVHSCAF